MVKMVPLDPRRHGGMSLRQGVGYGFAANQALVPITALEFASAALAMPIGFIEHSKRYMPVAVASPLQGGNLFISPTGQWLGNYIPAALRSYPFRLGRAEGSTVVSLWIDEDSGALVDADKSAARFFEDDGSPTPAIKGTMEFLQKIEEDRAITSVVVAALAEARVIQPWHLTTTINNQQVSAQGLFGVDETALNALDSHNFMKLRDTSALVLAYAQLISRQQVGMFGSLERLQQQLVQQARPLPHATSLFPVDDGGTIKFN